MYVKRTSGFPGYLQWISVFVCNFSVLRVWVSLCVEWLVIRRWRVNYGIRIYRVVLYREFGYYLIRNSRIPFVGIFVLL